MTKAQAKIVFAIVVLCATLNALQQAPPPQQASPAPTAQPDTRAAQEPHGEDQPPILPPTTDEKEIVRRATEVDHHNFER
ncbi:MAG TPA: hypothetical protein VNB54_02485, partial [Alphaproteobacteria bacterium]|nr:hypothetical protein [Alphaproteobacteria bacterium]